MMTLSPWGIWYIDMWRVYSGSCITITVELHRGDGFMTIIMPLVSLVRAIVSSESFGDADRLYQI